MQNFRTLFVAIITGLCSIAGTVAYVAPAGDVQRNAASVANICEANGFRAWPREDVPAPAMDAGTPSPQVPATPSSSGTFHARPASQPEARAPGAPRAPGAWLPTVERWPGEARGWAGAPSTPTA